MDPDLFLSFAGEAAGFFDDAGCLAGLFDGDFDGDYPFFFGGLFDLTAFGFEADFLGCDLLFFWGDLLCFFDGEEALDLLALAGVLTC